MREGKNHSLSSESSDGGRLTNDFHIRTGHNGRPVFATDEAELKLLSATYLPFGGVHTATRPNPNLRFLRQWFQSKTGLHQNWMRDYDPILGRYLQADPLALVYGASIYGYALQNPGRYIDPTGLYCVTMNGQTTCRSPGGTNISWPAQPGWGPNSYLGPETSNYHYYDKSTLYPDRLYDVECLLRELIDAPEPLPSNGASYQGTRNYANPKVTGGGIADAIGMNPVTSFIVTDKNTGTTGIANVTNPGHTLSHGYVARFPTRNGIVVIGEGNGRLQAPWNPTRFPINSVWGPANERIMEKCLCES